jgi:hypothetical protein
VITPWPVTILGTCNLHCPKVLDVADYLQELYHAVGLDDGLDERHRSKALYGSLWHRRRLGFLATSFAFRPLAKSVTGK